MSPHVGTLGPGQGTRVRVEFCPEDPPPPTPPPAPTPEPPELDEDGNPIEKPDENPEDEDADGDADGDAGDADGAEAVEGEDVEGEDAPAPEPEPEPEPEEPPEPKRDVWRVPVFIKAAPPLTEDEQTFDPNDDDEVTSGKDVRKAHGKSKSAWPGVPGIGAW